MEFEKSADSADIGRGGPGRRRRTRCAARDGRSARNRMYQCVDATLSGARHELFHEINREEVFGDIVDWVSKL